MSVKIKIGAKWALLGIVVIAFVGCSQGSKLPSKPEITAEAQFPSDWGKSTDYTKEQLKAKSMYELLLILFDPTVKSEIRNKRTELALDEKLNVIHKNPEFVQKQLKELKGKNNSPYIRASAAIALSTRTRNIAKTTSESLVKLFSDPNGDVRGAIYFSVRQVKLDGKVNADGENAFRAAFIKEKNNVAMFFMLGAVNEFFGDDKDRLIKKIISLLTHKDFQIRMAAAEAFDHHTLIEDDGGLIVSGILRLLKDSSPYVREAASKTLGRYSHHDETTLSFLIHMLIDKAMAVRKAAIRSLIRITKFNETKLNGLIERAEGVNGELKKVSEQSKREIKEVFEAMNKEEDH